MKLTVQRGRRDTLWARMEMANSRPKELLGRLEGDQSGKDDLPLAKSGFPVEQRNRLLGRNRNPVTTPPRDKDDRER
jgi:hypothetical protein